MTPKEVMELSRAVRDGLADHTAVWYAAMPDDDVTDPTFKKLHDLTCLAEDLVVALRDDLELES